MQPIQIQLSKELIFFFNFSLRFSSLHLIFTIWKKKVETHSLCIPEIRDGEKRAYVIV